MSSLNDYLQNAGARYEPAVTQRPSHPKGFEPGISFNGREGSVIATSASVEPPKWAKELEKLGFDPEDFDVQEPFEVRTWDSVTSTGRGKPNKIVRLWYYKAKIVTRKKVGGVDLEQYFREIRKLKPKKTAPNGVDASLVVLLADWQVGKADGGGTEGVIGRLVALETQIPQRIKELKKLRRPVDTVYLVGMGDLGEGCNGWYPMQTFTVELDHREQRKVVRRALLNIIKAVAAVAPRVVVVAVGGNHGEQRDATGKAYTTFADNTDVAVFEDVFEILRENPGYDHVSFVIPEGELEVALNISGTTCGFIHGHQAGRGSSANLPAKVQKWWSGQQHGQQPIGDAMVLFTAHYHHLSMVQNGPRTWFQCPALEGSSDWFIHTNGVASPPGTLTVRIDSDGWSDAEVLR